MCSLWWPSTTAPTTTMHASTCCSGRSPSLMRPTSLARWSSAAVHPYPGTSSPCRWPSPRRRRTRRSKRWMWSRWMATPPSSIQAKRCCWWRNTRSSKKGPPPLPPLPLHIHTHKGVNTNGSRSILSINTTYLYIFWSILYDYRNVKAMLTHTHARTYIYTIDIT